MAALATDTPCDCIPSGYSALKYVAPIVASGTRSVYSTRYTSQNRFSHADKGRPQYSHESYWQQAVDSRHGNPGFPCRGQCLGAGNIAAAGREPQNDSSIIFKATQSLALSSGYSRALWSNDAGTLFIGGEAHLYDMRLSGLGVRFGDITDSEELFDQIRNSDYESDTRLSFDAGVLWVADNYQFGAQLTNLNEPVFQFPDISTDPFTNEGIIRKIEQERSYEMERQLKLEASLFNQDRSWSWHLGLDANAASDPVGDEYQWLTVSSGFDTGSLWLPNVRLGYRQNLAGTEKTYASLGMTMFKYMNIDIASALDVTKIDGRRLPEGLILSIGFQIDW